MDIMEQSIANDTERQSCEVCGDDFVPDGRRKSRCAKEHLRDCTNCGESFTVLGNDKASKEFCSRSCSNSARSRSQICPICGDSFAKRSKTCSRTCSAELRSRTLAERTVARDCAHCGESFEAVGTQIYCDRQHFDSCEVCSESFEIKPESRRRTCSSICAGSLINGGDSQSKRRATSRDRYGTDFPQQSEAVKGKIARSNLDRYGYSTPLASPELREKGKKTNLARYGAEHYLQSEEGKAALRNTYIDRYGVPNIAQNESIKERIRDSFLKKYGVDHPLKDHAVLSRLQSTNTERYGVPNVLMDPAIKRRAMETFSANLNSGKFTHSRISKINRLYGETLSRELGVEVEFEAPLGSYFADLRIVTGRQEFLIDIHPTVSHNSQLPFGCLIGGCESDCAVHSVLPASYHQSRARQALDSNRRLIQWYGWNDLDGLISLLRPKLQPAKKFSSRRLELIAMPQKDANRFLKNFHIQGGARAQSHCYGLSLDGEILAVATFGKSRFGSSLDYEFIRYAVRPGFIVYGGAGRLLERFLEDVGGGSIVSYVDFDHTTSRSVFLLQSGFSELAPTGPGLIWHRLSDGRAVRNTSLLAQGADRILGTSYGSREASGVNNSEIMLLEGFLPVHTSGNRVFELRR